MIFNKNLIISGLLLVTLFSFITGASPIRSAELSFRAEKTDGPTKISLVISRAEKLAGVKVTVSYDKELLFFAGATKSAATSAFLHVVNDKTPGKIIMVMASAKGISGDNVVLLQMEFTKTAKAVGSQPKLAVTELQLMDENLKEVVANHPQFLF